MSEVELDELFRRFAKDHFFLARLLKDLESRIDILENAEKRFTLHSEDQLDNDRFNGTQFDIPNEDRLTLDTRHGVITLPQVAASSRSKLFFTDSEGNEMVPSTLEMRVVGKSDTADGPAAFVDSSDPEYALYRKPGLVWERNVIVNSEHSEGAELTLYVKVPTDLFTTNKSNTISIHPFPYFGTTIKEIAYTLSVDPMLRDSDGYNQFNTSGHYAGETRAEGWVIPGGWDGAYEGDDAISDAGPRIFFFEPKPVTGLRIKLHQGDYFREAAQYIYSYGLSHLDLRYTKFLSEGRAILRFDAAEGETISSVQDVQAQMWNIAPASLWEVFDYRVIWETAPESGDYTLDPVPNSQRVWIELTLKNTPNWTPALSGLVVDYA